MGAWAGVDVEERLLAGRVCGTLWVLAAITVSLFVVLPGVDHAHDGWVLSLAAGSLVWGLAQAFVIPWRRVPGWLLHISVLAGFAVIATLVASSGASRSPGWIYLFFVVVFASYFFPAPAALVVMTGCMLVQAAPIVYDHSWTHTDYTGELVIAAPAYFAFGVSVLLGKALMRRHRARAEMLAGEQAALWRVATAVIRGELPEVIYDLVARECAALLGSGAAGVLRFDNSDEGTVMGSWADHEGGTYASGTVIPVRRGSDIAQARDLNVPVRIEGHAPGSPVANLGYTASIVCPVMVGGRAWGALAVAASEPARLSADDEQHLMEFGALLAIAISSVDERAVLANQATTDSLTGLANRRALQERLVAEASRAQRHSRTLSVAVVDVDHFKEVNDYGGHDAGDEVLVELARCLSDHARAEDTLGRLGGDEFAWIMPETTREQALVAVERLRRVVSVSSRRHRITVSAGICDTTSSIHPAELVSFADSALYWSKAHGRNRCWIYDPEIIGQLSQLESAGRLERSHSLLALRALARAIDAKDPEMREHSERVAQLVAKLARKAGWSPERSIVLGEAALMHDVGKVAVPDEVLNKRGPLSREELKQIREHAELTARIVEGVLESEQVDWIRAHHERPDGTGYPRGLGEGEISDGAALLSLADAWDVMTSGHSYGHAKTIEAALRECAELVGRQFTRAAVGALLELHAEGNLDQPLEAGESVDPLDTDHVS